jgi:hypothetical protein
MNSEINLKGLMNILSIAQYSHIKKRENLRILFQIGLKGIITLRDEMNQIIGNSNNNTLKDLKTFDLILIKYFE